MRTVKEIQEEKDTVYAELQERKARMRELEAELRLSEAAERYVEIAQGEKEAFETRLAEERRQRAEE